MEQAKEADKSAIKTHHPRNIGHATNKYYADLAAVGNVCWRRRWKIKQIGLTNGGGANWALEVEFSPFRALSVVKWRSRSVAKLAYSRNGGQ